MVKSPLKKLVRVETAFVGEKRGLKLKIYYHTDGWVSRICYGNYAGEDEHN
jgi:hypothetical protein